MSLVAKVYAQSGSVGVPQPPGMQITDVGLLISRAVSVALMVAAIAVFVFLVWGGVQWITSGGDKGKVEEARGRITNALIGLAIVAAAWAIMNLVSYFFGVDVLGPGATIPTAY
ncbi:hypothetical protein A2W24_00420 [Microgenomates group bacterium RBG_16_45_19]|nr:MAG: hypothetical protein A2W24_00420 [Microgenomates group bacterium RBG_16_45_19]